MRLFSFIVFGYWLVAFARTLVNLASVPRLRARKPRYAPPVSVIIPARNEEGNIEATVRALLAQTYVPLEIIVVNDRSHDDTGAILGRLADPRLVVIDGEEPPPGWLGKPWALHQGSRRATGALLLFMDADIVYHAPEAIESAVADFEEAGAPMLSLFPKMEMRGFWDHVAMPNLAAFAFMLVPLWLSNRTRIPLFAIGGGPGNLARRYEYEAAGGHEALHDAVVDDVALARLFRRKGHRTRVVRADSMIRVHMYDGLREIVDGFTKNGFAVCGYNYFVALLFVSAGIALHVVPYAVALTGDPFAIASVLLITLTRLVLFSFLGYGTINALFAHPLMLALWCYIMLRSVWLTGIRRRLLWRGRTYDARRTRFGAD